MKLCPSLPTLLMLMLPFTYSHGQGCSGINITFRDSISATCNGISITMIHDDLNRPYLYVAVKDSGLKIYDISTLTAPLLKASIPVSSFGGLHVMSLSQYGNYLYLAIGNSFTNPQQGGVAIIDVSNPVSPVVTGYYVVPGSSSGAGIVKVEGNYAYLGAMGDGLVILDVTSKSAISFVSQLVPDINYPSPNPNPLLYNARGMEVKNSIVYLCYDAGGIRIINCTNKSAPVETGHYVNPLMYQPFNLPRAYNNLVLDDTLLYVTVDYCGLEVLNISDTSNITLTGWWNPYNCPGNNWFSSPVHANEIQYNKNCKLLFISTGKSDLHVLDISNPAQPDSCNIFGGVSNNLGTWGVGLYQDQIYLSYICTLGIPFTSNWTGVKILTYTPCNTGIADDPAETLRIFPNPVRNKIELCLDGTSSFTGKEKISVYSLLGEEWPVTAKISSGGTLEINISGLTDGFYFLRAGSEKTIHTVKFLKTEN